MIVKLFDRVISACKRLKFHFLHWRLRSLIKKNAISRGGKGEKQDLEVYWDENFARELSTWGLDTAWLEI